MKHILTLLLLVSFAQPAAAQPIIEAGVCIYGGVVAAVQAARMGKSVVIAEPGQHLGGMTILSRTSNSSLLTF
jgi:parvulin-like peptidyl-prolyl isomerase